MSKYENRILFKIFLQNNDGSTKKVGIFSYEFTGVSYSAIRWKIIFTFCGTRHKVSTISWIDRDGDAFQISNDEQLVDAILYSNKRLKLYVYEDTQIEKSRNNQILKKEERMETLKEDLLKLLKTLIVDVYAETSSHTLNISQTNKTKEKEECQSNISTGQIGTEKFPEDTKLVVDSTDKTFTSDNAPVSNTETTIKETEGILDKNNTSDMSSASLISRKKSIENQVSAAPSKSRPQYDLRTRPICNCEKSYSDDILYKELARKLKEENIKLKEKLREVVLYDEREERGRGSGRSGKGSGRRGRGNGSGKNVFYFNY